MTCLLGKPHVNVKSAGKSRANAVAQQGPSKSYEAAIKNDSRELSSHADLTLQMNKKVPIINSFLDCLKIMKNSMRGLKETFDKLKRSLKYSNEDYIDWSCKVSTIYVTYPCILKNKFTQRSH